MSTREVPHRFLAQDGVIWPRARPDMTDPGDIADRMATDIDAMHRDTGSISTQHLILRGWRGDQVTSHIGAALDVLARKKQRLL